MTWLMALVMAAAQPGEEALPGWWQGQLSAEAGGFRFALHLTRGDDGRLAGALDSVDQGVDGIPLADLSFADGQLGFRVTIGEGRFRGRLAADGQSLAGTLSSHGADLALTFKRAAGPLPRLRPQEPSGDLPYQALEVSVPVPAAPGVKLAGTLTVPPGPGRFPAAVLIAGSGPTNRDESVFTHRPFLVLADHLTRHGIAVLRYDKRGIAGSSGDYASATLFDLAADAEAAARWLRDQPQIAGDRVGLIGHSEGGLVAPLVAARVPEVAYLVLLAGPAVIGSEVLIHQNVLMHRLAGFSPAALARLESAQRAVLRAAAAGGSPAGRRERLRPLVRNLLAAEGAPDDPALVDKATAQVNTPWMQAFISYDPAPALRRVRCPTLALWGDLDMQVDPAQNLPALVAAFESGGLRDYTVTKVPRVNHLLQPATTGNVDEYARTSVTILPDILEQVRDWILRQTRPRA
jgi:hypothetical protein